MFMVHISLHSNLISLDLWRNPEITAESLDILAQGCFLLEELEIGWW